MKICFATCKKKPGITDDDLLLKDALEERGHTVAARPWSDGKTAWKDYDLCLLRSTWDYHHRLEEFLAWMKRASAQTTIVNSPGLVAWNASKKYLLALEKSGFSTVPTTILDNEDKAFNAARKLLKASGAVILKPAVSADADLTFKIEAEKELMDAVRVVLDHSPLLIQPFIESIAAEGEVSLVYFNLGGRPEFSHAVHKKPRKGDFRVQLAFGGTMKSLNAPRALRGMGALVLKSLKHPWAYARVDLIDAETQPKISELELIEPDLYFRHDEDAAGKMARAVEEQAKT